MNARQPCDGPASIVVPGSGSCLAKRIGLRSTAVKIPREQLAPRITSLLLASLVALSCGPPLDVRGVGPDESRDGPILLLVSIDGFRHDFRAMFDTPALDRLADAGVAADALMPVFPALTFPNHYSIATGLHPASHGIVGNRFPARDRRAWYDYKDRRTVQDGSWYGGVPIWVAAERAGMPSAAFYFVGTEADVGGVRPRDWRAFDETVSAAARVDTVLEWLARPAETRPRVVTLYFEQVDNAAHRDGPESAATAAAVAAVDAEIGRLLDGLDRLDLSNRAYVLVVSDHGQYPYRADRQTLVLDEVVDLDGFAVVDGGPYAFLYADEADAAAARRVRDEINEAWPAGRAWTREEAPVAWHLRDAALAPDVIVLAEPGHGVIATRAREFVMTRGDHGWDPKFGAMHGMFLASGPRLPAGQRIAALSVVDVYPLMLEVLGLPELPHEGDAGRLLPLLEPPR